MAKPTLLGLVRIGLLIAGVVCVLTGLLPREDAVANLCRIAPLLLFLGSVIVLTGLARHAQVFDTIATRLAIVAATTPPCSCSTSIPSPCC
jgi:arsenical pump membrane protein